MQSRIRCRLYVGESMYDVTNDLINWDDIYSKLKRVNYGGVMRSFAGKFEFVRKAREIIREDLMNNMVYSAPRLVWYERDENWAWKEVFGYVLDVSSFDDDGSVVSISAVDNSLESIIKAKKGTQYEYSVDVIKEEKLLYYDRLRMMSTLNFTFSDTFTVNALEDNVNLSVTSFNNEISEGAYIEPDTNERGVVANLSDVPDGGIDIELDIDTEYENKGDGTYITVTLSSVGKTKDITINKGESKHILLNIHITKSDFDSFQQQKRIYMSIILKSATGKATYAVFNIKKINKFTASYTSRTTAINIDIVSPKMLLNRLLKSMNGGKEGFVGEIESGVDDRINNCVIVAAESVRGLPKAKLYTSFTKFCDWMSSVFGFVYEIDGEVVRFAHRDSMYSRAVIGNIGTDISEFNCRVEPSLIYSRVNVGYDKQDYDSVNGRDEFRFTTEYSTGITLTNNKLELISPYRADAYGIEFLAQKRGADTTDKESDNDVFFVGAKMSVDGARWELVRGGKYQLSGVISPDTMFNAMFSPRQMLVANKAFIGVSVDTLEYASSNGNSDVAVGGIGEKESVEIGRGEALFLPMSVDVKTSQQELPDNKKGLIMVEYDGDAYRGFIDDIERYHGKSKSNSYNLILFDISKTT